MPIVTAAAVRISKANPGVTRLRGSSSDGARERTGSASAPVRSRCRRSCRPGHRREALEACGDRRAAKKNIRRHCTGHPSVEAVNNHEFAATDTSKAFDYYLETVNGVLELAGTVYILFDGAGTLAPNKPIKDAIGAGADMAIATAGKHSLQGHTTLHSLILLATWSAFESMVVDICVSALQAEPQLLESKPFEKAKLPARSILLDRADQIALVGDVVFHDNRQPLDDTGKGKFENQLSLVGLDGDIPDDVAKTLVVANAYRNCRRSSRPPCRQPVPRGVSWTGLQDRRRRANHQGAVERIRSRPTDLCDHHHQPLPRQARSGADPMPPGQKPLRAVVQRDVPGCRRPA
jgi:hypothetical protein